MVIRQKLFQSQTSRLEGCGLCVRWISCFPTPLSHGSILLPRLVGCASWCAQGGGQGAEEAGQQCETKAPPGTKHGPAIAMANVLREAIHVAREAGQLKVDSCHTCAQGDDAACSCVSKKKRNGLKWFQFDHDTPTCAVHLTAETGITLLLDIDQPSHVNP